MSNRKKLLLTISLLFYSFYVLGVIFPKAWWATHFINFLDPVPKIALLLAGLGIILYGAFAKSESEFLNRFSDGNLLKHKVVLPLILATFSVILFVKNPISTDVYGDAVRFSNQFNNHSEFNNVDLWEMVLSPNVLDSKTGETTVLPAAYMLQHSHDLTTQEAFLIIDAICGFLYIFLTLLFLRHYVQDKKWCIALSVVVITSPILQLFAGHIEIYAPALLLISLFVITQLMFLKTDKRLYLFALIPITFLMMKVHSSSFLFLPSLGFTVGYALLKNKRFWKKRFNWRIILIWIVTPFFILGAYVYFVLLEDHIDPRWLQGDLPVLERIFLPIFSPEVPFDRYNLFSLNHIFDYFNLMLMWSAGGMLLFVSIVGFYRKKVNWNAPAVIITGISILFGVTFFFMVNPLLSLPIDFDLFCLPAPVFILFVAAVVVEMKGVELSKILLGGVFALGLMYIPIVAVNSDDEMLSQRTEAVAVHVFKTYWSHAGDLITESHGMVGEDQLQINRARQLVDELEPYAVPAIDQVYSTFVLKVARHYLVANRMDSALYFYEKSLYYQSESKHDLPGLMECYFMLKQFERAHHTALLWNAASGGYNQQAVRAAIQSGLEAELYEDVVIDCEEYLKRWPNDEQIKMVYKSLRSGTNVEQLKNTFRSRPE
jgi:hypothetical protein